ncbi:MAG: TlpA disulfide reductase family protein [Verrucomicrobiota bacterium JB022]|nr:TlpA disulfide reductase family protein [Verrucomicrobiota bacterium JB022]
MSPLRFALTASCLAASSLSAWTLQGSGTAFTNVDQLTLTRGGETLATIPVEDGRFAYESDAGSGYFGLSWGDQSLELALLADQSVRIEAADLAAGLHITGSPDTHLLQAYHDFRRASLARLVYPVRAAAKAAREAGHTEEVERQTELEVSAYAAHRRELVDFTLAALKGSPALATAALRWGGDYRLEELAAAVDTTAEAFPEAPFAAELQQKVAALQRVAIGAEAPAVEGASPEGETVRLADYRGKWVLLDFWASWCPPCRVENAHYRELYAQYAEQGFEIVAVSLDQAERGWKRAIQQDQAGWVHLSDLQGLKSPLATAYSVTALPASFLIDPQGKIVATDLRGPALAQRLAEVFE